MGFQQATRASWTIAILLATTVMLRAQGGPPPTAGQGAGGAGAGAAGRGTAAPPVTTLTRVTAVDLEAHDRGRALWATHCVTCHGSQARGTESGPNIIRSRTVNYDRAAVAGTVLAPYLKAGHPTQSGKPSNSFTDREIADIANFVRQRVNETMRGSPTYIVLPENLLTGDPKAGEAVFKSEGCTKCHNADGRNLAGIASRITDPQQLQARVLYPAPGGAAGRGGGRGGRGAPVPAAPVNPTGPRPPNPLLTQVTITPATGAPMTGTLIEQDAFFITFSDAAGVLRTVARTPDLKVVTTNPMQWHLDFAGRITDAQMHDLTAYLWSLK